LKLYDYLQAKREAREEAEENSEHETGFLEILNGAIKIDFKPEALSNYMNFLRLMYRIGLDISIEKIHVRESKINRMVFMRIHYQDNERDEKFEIILSDVVHGKSVIAAEVIVENTDTALEFMKQCIDVCDLKYHILNRVEGNKDFASMDDRIKFLDIENACMYLKQHSLWDG